VGALVSLNWDVGSNYSAIVLDYKRGMTPAHFDLWVLAPVVAYKVKGV
jgi:hypothetical protein